MRAIIIEDKDARALLDKLRLEKFQDFLTGPLVDKISVADHKALLDEVHRKFHYVVCTWLQDQGANIIH